MYYLYISELTRFCFKIRLIQSIIISAVKKNILNHIPNLSNQNKFLIFDKSIADIRTIQTNFLVSGYIIDIQIYRIYIPISLYLDFCAI